MIKLRQFDAIKAIPLDLPMNFSVIMRTLLKLMNSNTIYKEIFKYFVDNFNMLEKGTDSCIDYLHCLLELLNNNQLIAYLHRLKDETLPIFTRAAIPYCVAHKRYMVIAACLRRCYEAEYELDKVFYHIADPKFFTIEFAIIFMELEKRFDIGILTAEQREQIQQFYEERNYESMF